MATVGVEGLTDHCDAQSNISWTLCSSILSTSRLWGWSSLLSITSLRHCKFNLQVTTSVYSRLYTGWPQKSKPRSFLHIFANYWPIFKIFSLLHSVKNL